ncbi:Ppx/GppA phosphatase family protein [Hyphococcus flavus]|uniref:Ppx/GppA phosphatase family protein n=1 Tax=Hyphococcus flavus TaxID=1866326 RepID=A0AAE9ZJ15_9PROT|nr:Ppx/GppA phosphatase family protein [Hyphococcus flavus]WDI31320.1 Ppx/GppA phosphatase family protein [Hyphococcus flavus]
MTEVKSGGDAGGRGGGKTPQDRQAQNASKQSSQKRFKHKRRAPRLAALDLGTNNCRLLIAAPSGKSLRIVDAYSQIVRLGEGLSKTGVLSQEAMQRTFGALEACAEKIKRRGVTHMRCIATQACRGAENGEEFLQEVKLRTGLEFEVISTEEEARLAVAGCAELIDDDAPSGLIFDIGGGSTELSWVQRKQAGKPVEIATWASMPFGVVSLSEKWGGRDIDAQTYADIVEEVRLAISELGDPEGLKNAFQSGNAHLLGTSGTVTSIAGVHLRLRRYRRDKVDGLWLTAREARGVSEKLRKMSFDERADEPCIGRERADLVVCGCAILDALLHEWPAERIRVADRGLREGILAELSLQARKERNRRRRANR